MEKVNYRALSSLPDFSDYYFVLAQCCLGGYGGDEKLPNPYYSQSSSIPGASDSSLTLDDVAPFAE